VSVASFFGRWRVRLGYLVTIVVLWRAHPTPRSVAYGACVGLVGLWIRAYAAGFLHKQEVLTITGPYSRTRNPLYLGSAVLALGAGIATDSWTAAVLLLVYFAVVYAVVMRREEGELRAKHNVAFDDYSRRVPLFFPRLMAARQSATGVGSFSWAQYKKNHEYEASIGYVVLLGVLLLIWRLRLH
jgi:protein-S-isoprenylcysteine O-methyltransferase Ste14